MEDLDAAERQRGPCGVVGFLEPLLAIDELKERYDGWYGIDYVRHPGLHARAFALAFAALCAQVDAGQTLLEMVAGQQAGAGALRRGHAGARAAGGDVPARCAPARARARLLYVPIGAEWFLDWIDPHLHNGPAGERARAAAWRRASAPAQRWTKAGNAQRRAGRTRPTWSRSEAFSRWFPVQKEVASGSATRAWRPTGGG